MLNKFQLLHQQLQTLPLQRKLGLPGVSTFAGRPQIMFSWFSYSLGHLEIFCLFGIFFGFICFGIHRTLLLMDRAKHLNINLPEDSLFGTVKEKQAFKQVMSQSS